MTVSHYDQWLVDNMCFKKPAQHSGGNNQKMLVMNKMKYNHTEHWAMFLDPDTPLTHYVLYTTSGDPESSDDDVIMGCTDPQMTVIMKLFVFPRRKQIFVVDAQVQYQDNLRHFNHGRLRVLKKGWFRHYQRHIMQQLTGAFFGSDWRVCYGMYTRHVRSIFKHYKRRNMLGNLVEQLPWFHLVHDKEFYKLTRGVREYVMNQFVRYVSYYDVCYNKPSLVDLSV